MSAVATLAATLAALGVTVWVGAPARPAAARLGPTAARATPPGGSTERATGEDPVSGDPASGVPGARRRHRLVLVAGGLGVVLAAWLGVGPRGAAFAIIGLVPTLTAATLVRGRRRSVVRARVETEVARACSLVAAEVRAGRSPEGAVGLVAGDCPVLVPAAAALGVGDDVVRTWRRQATRPGCDGLAELARAWEVSRACGAPMGPSLDQVADALEREAEVSRLVRGELASAQATGRLMAVLPVVGIGLGYSIGGRPVDFLLHTTIGLGCLVGAVVLASAGTLWTTALARTPGREG
ncbi:hypothetical protein [Raineyella sp.]|uniref:type II secretion system F family protein n=1 Tax=Raineyella sp. TaxID=1911550 RepID=UPI002B20D52C|nr:hypothetical protein [Raineyella sp.]MEA5153847.1 hypothetical protein [Raineyella sp.]